MYLPDHFREADRARMLWVMARHPLCTLVARGPEGLIANHLPMLWKDETTLVGHMAMANPLHDILDPEEEVLAIFQGDDAYISPNWYPSKVEHHRHVPTWNYCVVHVHGRLAFHHDEKTKIAVVGRLTQVHERRTNGANAWRMADAPRDYMAEMLDNIVAFSLEVRRIDAKFKVSQNREPSDLAGAAAGVAAAGHSELADLMRSR